MDPLTERLIVVGASAGGLEALQRLVAGLPADLPAAVLVVLHLQPSSPSPLPTVLTRSGPLPARQPRTGDPVRPGEILVAPPDRHLLVHDSTVRLSPGPRENGRRPSIDPLFRSAAAAYGPGVVAVVLSGALDDGAAGAAAVAAQDGAVLVQDPDEARVSGMPRATLAAVRRARALPAAALAAAVTELVHRPTTEESMDTGQDRASGSPVALGCPECQGGMAESARNGTLTYACHVGHTWSAQTLLDAQRRAAEGAVYAAAAKLLEMAAVHRRLAAERADGDAAEHLQAAAAAEARARRIQELAAEEPGPA